MSAPPLRGEDVVQLGVMLSRFDGGGTQAEVGAGAFQLRLRRLEAYRTCVGSRSEFALSESLHS